MNSFNAFLTLFLITELASRGHVLPVPPLNVPPLSYARY